MPTDYDALAKQLGGSSQQEDDFDRLAKGLGGGVSQIGNVPQTPQEIQALHQLNTAREAQAYQDAKSGTELSSAGLRAVGGALGWLPWIGPPLAASGDIAAQMVEKAGGQRQTYNPARTVVEMGISRLPGLGIASRAAAAKPIASGMMGKAAQIAGQVGANVAEGAATGAGIVGATSLAEGEVPSLKAVGTGAGIGGSLQGVLGMRPALRGIHEATKKARAPMQVPGKIAEAVGLPPKLRGGAASLQTGVPLALEHAKDIGATVHTVDDLATVSKDAIKTFGTEYIDPLKQAFGNHMLSLNSVVRKMGAKVKPVDIKYDPKVADEMAEEVNKLRSLKSASEVLDYYHNLQADLLPYKTANPTERAAKYRDTTWRFKLEEESALRDLLASHFDVQRARAEGTSVARLKSEGNDFRSIHEQYGALRSLTNLSDAASNQLKNIKLRQQGEPWSPGRAVEEVVSPVILSKRRLLGKAIDWATNRGNNPDDLVKAAFEDYNKYMPPPKRPTRFLGVNPPAQGPRPVGTSPSPQTGPQAPTQGQTVPMTISPVPQPPPINPYMNKPRLLNPAVIEQGRVDAAEQAISNRYDPLAEAEATVPPETYLEMQGIIDKNAADFGRTFDKTSELARQEKLRRLYKKGYQ